jgi:hypothetical protein
LTNDIVAAARGEVRERVLLLSRNKNTLKMRKGTFLESLPCPHDKLSTYIHDSLLQPLHRF